MRKLKTKFSLRQAVAASAMKLGRISTGEIGARRHLQNVLGAAGCLIEFGLDEKQNDERGSDERPEIF